MQVWCTTSTPGRWLPHALLRHDHRPRSVAQLRHSRRESPAVIFCALLDDLKKLFFSQSSMTYLLFALLLSSRLLSRLSRTLPSSSFVMLVSSSPDLLELERRTTLRRSRRGRAHRGDGDERPEPSANVQLTGHDGRGGGDQSHRPQPQPQAALRMRVLACLSFSDPSEPIRTMWIFICGFFFLFYENPPF